MLKKHTIEYYDAYEVEAEIGVLAEECYFAEDASPEYFAILYCDDGTLEDMYNDKMSFKAVNEIKWIEYFRSLGYRDEVLIKIY